MYNENKELADFKLESQILENKTEIYKDEFINSLTNKKLGNDIKDTLSNPIKISKFKIFKIKTSNLIKDIFRIL